jgi:hypothetical protein
MMVLKVCKVHGPLEIDDIILRAKKDRPRPTKCCLFCTRETNKRSSRNSRNRRPGVYKQRDAERNNILRITMDDKYIKRLICSNSELKPNDITIEIIAFKRASLSLKRKLMHRSKQSNG